MEEVAIIKPNYNRDKNLLQSFAECIFYPVLLGECGGHLYLLDGYLRYRFGKDRVIFEKICFATMEEMFASIVRVNTAIRELHLIEKAFLISFAVAKSLKVNLASLLRMKVDDEVIWLAQKVAALPDFYLNILQGQKASFKQIEALFYFNDAQLKELEGVFQTCRFSQSNFYAFLSDLHDFLKIHETPLQQVLGVAEVRRILDDDRLSPYQRGENFLSYLAMQLRPHYHQSLARLNRLKAEIVSPGTIEIACNPNFEDEFCRITFKISTPEDVDNIGKMAIEHRENLYKLLGVIHGEDRS